MTTKQAADIIRMLLGYLKGEIEPPKQETIEEARAFEQQGYECLEMAIKALEQQPCEDWYDVPSYEMTLEQARQAVKDLRKKLAEYLEQKPCEDAISRKDMLAVLSQSNSLTQAWDGFEKLSSVTLKEKSEYEHDHEVVKAYNDGQAYILDKIRAEVEAKCCSTVGRENDGAITLYDIFEIIDKYRGE